MTKIREELREKRLAYREYETVKLHFGAES